MVHTKPSDQWTDYVAVSGLEGLVLAERRIIRTTLADSRFLGCFVAMWTGKVTDVSKERNFFVFRIRQSRKPLLSPGSLLFHFLSPDKILSTWQAIRIAMLLGMLKYEGECTTILRNVGICWLVHMA